MKRSTSPTRSPRDGSVRHEVSDGHNDMTDVITKIIVMSADSIAGGATGFFENPTNHIAMQNPGKALTTQCRLQNPKLRRNLSNHCFI
jgi:hypothetical protein